MKTYLIVGLLAALVIGGGVFYTQSNKANGTEEKVSPVSSDPKKEIVIKDGKYEGSISELSNSGDSYTCTVTSTTNGMISNGVVYVSGKNIRADFESEIPMAGKISTYMIADGEYVYTWSSMLSEGFKTLQTKDESSVSSESSVQSFDMNHKQSYDCNKTSVDNSKFELPSDVTFKALN